MTDRMKVYSKVKQSIKKMLPTAPENQRIVLGMLIAGIVLSQKAQLSAISLNVPHSAKPDSLAKRFQRFVKNERVIQEVLFMPFAKKILTALADKQLFITMDASQVGRGCMTLMVAVIYRQRALPLAWIVYEGKKGHTTPDRHIEVLQLLQTLVPEGTALILLGDAEYDTVEMLTWVTENTGWTFVVRTDPRILLTELGQTYRFADLLSGGYGTVMVSEALFTRQKFGPVTAAVTWQRGYKRPLYLISNHLSLQEIGRFYAKRYKIETMFSDKKSRGFNIHKSHLRHPSRLARLLLAAALAYLWIFQLGCEIVDDAQRRCLIDRPNRVDKSLFRLGLDWLQYALTRDIDFNVQFVHQFDPFPLGVR